MHTAGTIVLIIFLLLIAAGVGWIIYTRVRASQLGLPPPPLRSYIPFLTPSPSPYGPPQPAPGGIVGWINDRIRIFKAGRNSRTAAGAYEGGPPARSGGGRRGFGPLDPDDAWDSRVGAEADSYGPGGYYEEQELGLHHGDTGYAGASASGGGGSSYPMNLAATPGVAAPRGYGGDEGEGEERGRTKSRSPGRTGGRGNPFDDDAEPSNISLRGVSPRPIDTGAANAAAKSGGQQKDKDSPTERRSVFREDM
ncbi:hypothetical protein CONLIGDRAFT_697925 [Coniochaeta ligniaria NRRL 30616]|uniref:Acid phosphatase-like protein n=1 Tax=Coniochaeta ligniaria NRRL 30616 TaxID=1408157 RepID=A0A1J7IWX3_9PEZI|nr:hypothetical protein CONLIGDRAFT_697925 [Coniochaeta ligniaria NRRL 30616]